MVWGRIEVHDEVREWLLDLSETEFGQVRFHIERLAESGVDLTEPHTRQLHGKLRELRLIVSRQVCKRANV